MSQHPHGHRSSSSFNTEHPESTSTDASIHRNTGSVPPHIPSVGHSQQHVQTPQIMPSTVRRNAESLISPQLTQYYAQRMPNSIRMRANTISSFSQVIRSGVDNTTQESNLQLVFDNRALLNELPHQAHAGPMEHNRTPIRIPGSYNQALFPTQQDLAQPNLQHQHMLNTSTDSGSNANIFHGHSIQSDTSKLALTYFPNNLPFNVLEPPLENPLSQSQHLNSTSNDPPQHQSEAQGNVAYSDRNIRNESTSSDGRNHSQQLNENYNMPMSMAMSISSSLRDSSVNIVERPSIQNRSSSREPKKNSAISIAKTDSTYSLTQNKLADLKCKKCGRVYSRRDNLAAHQRVHTGEKPYQCSTCGKRFRWQSALKNHEGAHLRRGQQPVKRGRLEKSAKLAIAQAQALELEQQQYQQEQLQQRQVSERNALIWRGGIQRSSLPIRMRGQRTTQDLNLAREFVHTNAQNGQQSNVEITRFDEFIEEPKKTDCSHTDLIDSRPMESSPHGPVVRSESDPDPEQGWASIFNTPENDGPTNLI